MSVTATDAATRLALNAADEAKAARALQEYVRMQMRQGGLMSEVRAALIAAESN